MLFGYAVFSRGYPATSARLPGGDPTMLLRLGQFIRNGKNREICSWLGGGAVVIVAAAWTLFTYLHDDKKPGAPSATVANPSGSIIAPGGVFNGQVTIGTTGNPTAQQELQLSCEWSHIRCLS
jgi:hypothetical protein